MPKKILIGLFALLMPFAVFVSLIHQSTGGEHNLSDTILYAERKFSFNLSEFASEMFESKELIESADWSIEDYPKNASDVFNMLGRAFINIGNYLLYGLQSIYFLIKFSFTQIVAIFDIAFYLIF